MRKVSRRSIIKAGTLSFASLYLLPDISDAADEEISDELLLHEIKVALDRGENQYNLLWFEEWAIGAIEESGIYMEEKLPPGSFEESTLEKLQQRFETANKRFVELSNNLSAEDLKRPAQYIYNKNSDSRMDLKLKSILHIRTTHMAGHRYQVRFVRGTYSRASKTDKSVFDRW